MYLLDTDTISGLIARRPSPDLVAKFVSIPAEQKHISSITLAELLFGAFRLGQNGGGLLARIETIIQEVHGVLPFDEGAARRFAQIRAELEGAGTPLHESDLRIGSIALSNSFIIVTGNVRHFRRIPGVAIENWLQPSE